MHELIPNIYNNDVTFNQTRYKTVITNKNRESNTYGQSVYIFSTSGADSLSNLFDNSPYSTWTSSSSYKDKSDDPLTSITTSDPKSETCSGDIYKMGSCIHNYKGMNAARTTIEYIDGKGVNVKLNSNFPGEFITVKFPNEYYIFESFIEFNNDRYKPKGYFLLGYSNKHERWEMIGRNININYDKKSDRIKINKPTRYQYVILSITSSREEPSVKINKFQLYGSKDLRDHPNKQYIGIKQPEAFSNQIHKKTVRFDNTPEIRYIEPELNYIPTILIFSFFSFFALAIINKNKK
jgi:hypothetical protein